MYPRTIYRMNFNRALSSAVPSGRILPACFVYRLNFISRIEHATRTHVNTPAPHAQCGARAAPQIRASDNKGGGGEEEGRGWIGGRRRQGRPEGNTGSRAQAVPSVPVIFPFYEFHSFVSLRMLATWLPLHVGVIRVGAGPGRC